MSHCHWGRGQVLYATQNVISSDNHDMHVPCIAKSRLIEHIFNVLTNVSNSNSSW